MPCGTETTWLVLLYLAQYTSHSGVPVGKESWRAGGRRGITCGCARTLGSVEVDGRCRAIGCGGAGTRYWLGVCRHHVVDQGAWRSRSEPIKQSELTSWSSVAGMGSRSPRIKSWKFMKFIFIGHRCASRFLVAKVQVECFWVISGSTSVSEDWRSPFPKGMQWSKVLPGCQYVDRGCLARQLELLP